MMKRRLVVAVGLLVLLSVLAVGPGLAHGPAAPQAASVVAGGVASGAQEVSSAAQIEWLAKAPLPVTVGSFAYAATGGKIYIIGGDIAGVSSTTVQRYTPATDTWEVDTNHGGVLAPLPQARSFYMDCGVLSGKIHCVGGWQDGAYRGELFVYDPAINSWSSGPSIPQYPIGQFSATVNDKMYVFGGWWGTFKDYVFEYSEAGGWSQKQAMPTPRNHGTAAVYDGKVYVIGGMAGPSAPSQYPLDLVEVYDPQSDTWATGLAPMPAPMGYLGSSGAPVSGGMIYVLGPGTTAYGYNPASDSWSSLDSMPGEAWGIAAFDGSLYAIGPEHTFRGVTVPWAMFHHDPLHTGRSPYVGPQQNTVAWRHWVGGALPSSPAIGHEGTIYVGSENHKLYAIAPDGSLVWAFPTGGGVHSSPALADDGTIYVGSRDHNLYAIGPDGTLRWTFVTAGEVDSSPTVGHDGTIYVGSYDGKLYAINPDGTGKCSYPAGGVIVASPAIGPDGVVYVGSGNQNRMHAVNPDCTLKWQSDPPHGNVLSSSPALSPDGSTVYYGADDGYLYARSTADGSLEWRSPYTYGGVQSSPAIGVDGTVYVGTQYGRLWALDPADGSLKWENYTTLSAWSSPAIGADGTIYFASDYGSLFAMNPDGSVKWTYSGGYDAAGHFRSSPAIGSDGALYIGSTNGRLFVFHTTPPACGPAIGPWLQTTALPIPSGTTGARGQPLVVYQDRVYVFGGTNDAGDRLTNVYYSNINADGSLGPWIETTPLPEQYFDQVVVRVGKHVYLITGANGAVAVYYAPINADGTLGAWVRTADLLPSRQEFAAAAHGEYIYVVAGNASGLTDRVWFTSVRPDGSLNPWADTTPVPEAMQAHTMVAHDGTLYVFAPNSNIYSAAIQADGTVGPWGTETSLPQAMLAYTTFAHRQHVYLLGEPSRAVHYAPLLAGHSLGEWQATAPLPAQRNRLRAGGHGCFVYAIGGFDGSHFQDTVYYAPLQAPCEPVSSVRLSRLPSGDLFAGSPVRFVAEAAGTVPFTYIWTLDGTPVGENLGTFEHTFAAPGTYTVGVTVTNACGQGKDSMVVEVQELAPGRPNLSPSYKSVNFANVESGDTLTYTLWLRNASSTAALASLADPIPEHTTYVPGTAQASDGGAVTLAGGQLEWSGQVISGTPVIVSFAVEVQEAPIGTAIANVASLDDGLGNVLELAANSTYNPGFGLTINDGALYTGIPTVTLRYSWNVANSITHLKISNDGGFVPGDETTDWLPVDPENPTYTGWVLATYGNVVLPRTVYARFRDSGGEQYGPVQDDIIYDPDPPQVGGVEILSQAARGVDTGQEQAVIVRVTAVDANSGVGWVQISHDEGFGQFSEFACFGPATDIPWLLQPSGLIYVRVVDRAGNLSEVISEQGSIRIYLPFVARGAGGR